MAPRDTLIRLLVVTRSMRFGRQLLLPIAVGPLLLAAGCSGSSGSHFDAAPPDTNPGMPDTRDTIPSGCPPALASASELAATPRADTNLELLAIAKSPLKLIADQAIYDRLVRDVRLIRAERPSLANVSFWPRRQDGKRLGLRVPTSIVDQIEKGEYHGWDCLNAAYGLENIETFQRISREYVSVTLKGIYNMDLIAAEYAQLPEVISVETTVVGGDGPTICLSMGPDVWQYAFDEASGDCPAGCTEHHYWLFSTSAAGPVMASGDWIPGNGTVPAAVTACVPR